MIAQALGEPLGALAVIVLGGLAPFLFAPIATALIGEPAARVQRVVNGISEDIAEFLGKFAQVCLLVLALGMLSTVLLRYIFGESFTKLNEAVMYAHALGFLMAAPAALLANAHVRVDVFYEHVQPKTKALIDLLGYCFFLAPVMILLLLYSGPVVELAWRIGERSPETDGLPLVFLLKTAMPIFAVTMLMAGITHAGHAALRWRGLEALPEPSATKLPLGA
jgi:TRAP-type mannitol/chloroaromatic compound transport system permease small subunit